jgi:outer membrane lipoprotein-sorting protein
VKCRTLSIIHTIFLSSALNFLGFASIPDQQDQLSEILERLEKNYNKAETVSCSFEQRKKIRQLTEIMSLSGKLYFKKPHFLRMEFRGDENFDFYTNGMKVWLVDFDFDEVESFEFKKLDSDKRISRLLPPVFFKTTEEMKEIFNFFLRTDRGKTQRIEIIPIRSSDVPFESLKFDVDSLGRITWMKVHYNKEEYTEMNFRNWKRHPEISDYYFQYRKSEKRNAHSDIS